jgi:hypothetical protein
LSAGTADPDPDPGEQKWNIIKEKVKKCTALKCWMFSFEGWRFLLELGLDVLHGVRG